MGQKINVHADVRLPRVPNFLHFEEGEQVISIADITEESLRVLGAEWTENLVQRAEEIRRSRGIDEIAARNAQRFGA